MIKASMDGELILRETDNVFPQLKNYCATARFVKPYILEIRIHWVNSWAETKMRFEYQKGIMKITSMKLRLNEEDNWLCFPWRSNKSGGEIKWVCYDLVTAQKY